MRKHNLPTTKRTSRVRLKDKKQWLVRGGLALLFLMIVVQLVYPSDRLLPFTKIDGIDASMAKRADITKKLNDAYDTHPINIYMGSGTKSVTSPKLAAADVTIDNTKRLERMDYPLYLRFVPTSLLWAGLKQSSVPAPTFGDQFDDYVEKYIMPSCVEQPVDATLKASGDKLTVVPSKPGGKCDKKDVLTSIKKVTPRLQSATDVRVARDEVAATIGNTTAQTKADELNTRLSQGVALQVGDQTVTIAAGDIMSWLDFASKDKDIAVSINGDRAGGWLGKNVAAKVAVAPGVSYITTRDFTEISRQNGASGQALDVPATVSDLTAAVNGDKTTASAITKVVPPTEQFTRTYSPSDAGLAALMKNYAKDHPGTYGIAMVELDGKKRRADYNGNQQFVTASTYKLFVAYSLLKQIDAGTRDWDSNAACFNKMISLSDNACAESFLNSLGLGTVTKDIQGIGLKNSTFMKSGGPFTTANDLVLELGMIATGQNFSSTNQQRLIAAMKGNVYRNGIPAGVNGTVADKVGFMDGLLHDAAIVYGPSGTYVLAIMTDGSSWGTIADLAKQLDKLHAQ